MNPESRPGGLSTVREGQLSRSRGASSRRWPSHTGPRPDRRPEDRTTNAAAPWTAGKATQPSTQRVVQRQVGDTFDSAPMPMTAPDPRRGARGRRGRADPGHVVRFEPGQSPSRHRARGGPKTRLGIWSRRHPPTPSGGDRRSSAGDRRNPTAVCRASDGVRSTIHRIPAAKALKCLKLREGPPGSHLDLLTGRI